MCDTYTHGFEPQCVHYGIHKYLNRGRGEKLLMWKWVCLYVCVSNCIMWYILKNISINLIFLPYRDNLSTISDEQNKEVTRRRRRYILFDNNHKQSICSQITLFYPPRKIEYTDILIKMYFLENCSLNISLLSFKAALSKSKF